MVKIKAKILMILGIVFLVCLSSAFAALEISNVDVKVDSKTDKDVGNTSYVSYDAKPESNIKITVEVTNTDASLEVNDITVTTTIEGIDDGDDLDDESKEFDLGTNNDKKVSFNFKVPLKVDEDDYKITIEAEGNDENRTKQTVNWYGYLTVDKETHELRIYKKILSETTLECGESTLLNIGVINTGTEEEEDVTLEIANSELKLSGKDTFTLSEDIDDDENSFIKAYSITTTKDTKAKTYPISIKATYDGGDETETATTDLTVTCAPVTTTTTTTATTTPTTTTTQPEEEVEVTTVPTTIQPPVIFGEVEEKTFWEENKYNILVGLAYLVIIIVAVVLIVKLFKR